MKLQQLQSLFGDAMAATGTAPAGDSALRTLIAEDGVAVEERLAVYRNNLRVTLVEALRAAYPLLEKLVGEDFFRAAGLAYAAAHPPRVGNLNYFGDAFPEFIEGFEAAASLPYLPDVARVEWAWHRAYYAPDEATLPLDELQALAPEDFPRVNLVPGASVTLVQSPFPVDEILSYCRNPGESAFTLSDRAVCLLVLRSDDEVQQHELAEGEFAFLCAMQAGATVADALDALSSPAISKGEESLSGNAGGAEPNGFDLVGLLQKHLALGSFAAFNLGTRELT